MCSAKIQIRRDTVANWVATNPILSSGEQGFETDTLKVKIGDGVTHWNDLDYITSTGNANNITDGTLDDARLSSNVPLLDKENTFTDTNTFPQIIIGEGTLGLTEDYPETVLIRPADDLSHTPVRIKSSIDNYFELLCNNTSNSGSASSDITCQADNGTLTNNYIDMGINSSNYTDDYVGKANEGYIYVDGGNFNIGTSSGGAELIFFTNGSDSYANEKMRITYDGKIICQGNITAPDGINVDHVSTVGQLNLKQDSLGDISGIVKGNGSGGYTSASAGTDYLTPTGNGSQLTNMVKSQVGLSNVTNTEQLPISYLDTSNTLSNDSDTKVCSQKAIKSYVDTGLSSKLSNIEGLNISDLTNDAGYLTTVALTDLTDVNVVLPDTGDVLKYNGSQWYSGQISVPVSGGAGVDLFPCDEASDISGYGKLRKTPCTDAEVDETAICNNNKVLIDSYASDSAGIGNSMIDAGVWNFNIWGYCSIADHTKIVVDVYKRVLTGTETLLFSAETGPLSTNLDLYNVQSAQPVFSTNTTDRIIVKISGHTNLTQDVTVHFLNQGAEHYSYFKTPLVVNHNDLSGLQGGTTNQYYHLTSAQATVVANTSGANTGDETTSTIKTKLGAASTSADGYLTSTNFNTFNNKISAITGDELENVFQVNGFLVRTDIGTFSIDANHYLTSSSNLNADYLSSGTINDSRLSTNVTKQGNTFNGTSQLVQTTSAGKIPAIDGSLITNMTKSQVSLGNVPNTDCTNATNISSGTLNDGRLSTSVTKQGNTFNGTSQLVQTTAAGYFPAVNGSLITNIDPANIASTNTAFNKNFETSTSNIKMNGTVAVGSSGNVADASHVHATDTSRLSTSLTSAYIFVGNGSGVATGVALSSDATISNTGALTLATVNSNIGTYNNITINAKGLATGGSNVSYLTANQNITVTGDTTGSGATSINTTIASGAVTLTKMANLGANTYIGNNTGSSAVPLAVSTNTAFNKNFGTSSPNMDGTASAGSSGNIADAAHTHPTDTSREAVANKSTSTSLGTSDTLYPTQNAVKTYVDTAVVNRGSAVRTSVGVTNNATQSISAVTNTLITFQVENYDINSEFTSNTFTSKSAQTVLVSGYVEYATGIFSTNRTVFIKIYKNGAEVFRAAQYVTSTSTATPSSHICFPVKVAIGDTIQLYTYHTNGGAVNIVSGGADFTIEQLY